MMTLPDFLNALTGLTERGSDSEETKPCSAPFELGANCVSVPGVRSDLASGMVRSRGVLGALELDSIINHIAKTLKIKINVNVVQKEPKNKAK